MGLPFAGLSFLVIGHVCLDMTPDGLQLGGCVTFASLTASRLGAEARVVTTCSPHLDLGKLLPGVAVHRVDSAATTTFHNIYTGHTRRQVLTARAGPVPEPPDAWRRSDIVLLGPLDQEVPAAWVRDYPDSLLGLCPQGWLRCWDEQGHIRPAIWPEASLALPMAGAVILSPADLGNDATVLADYARWSRLLVVTEGANGARVYHNGQIAHRTGYLAQESDPTGAGDVFAAAFLLHLARNGDPLQACDFANCVASFAVEAPGVAGIPTWEQVQERWGG